MWSQISNCVLSVDGCYMQWAASLRQQLLRLHPLPDGLDPLPDDEVLQPKWILEFADLSSYSIDKLERHTETVLFNNKDSHISNSAAKGVQFNGSGSNEDVDKDDVIPLENGITVTVADNERITPDSHWQDVRLVKLEANKNIPYDPGDAIAIQPKNSPEDVEHLIQLMSWNHIADRTIEFRRNYSSEDRHDGNGNGNTERKSLPPSLSFIASGTPLTLRKLITNYLDIMSIPRRSFFSFIAHFAADEYQKERLLEFTDPTYLDELYDYTTRPRRSILEVLQEFTSVKISWQWAAHVLPFMQSRQFSIASGGILKSSDPPQPLSSSSLSVPAGSLADPARATCKTRFELLVAIVKYKTVIKRIRRGVCTRYIAALQPGQRLNVILHKGGLRYSSKENETKPVLMIAPGTGVAPMRALIYERLALAQRYLDERQGNGEMSNQTSRDTPDTVLVFGCRNEGADYFFRHEWDAIIRNIDQDRSHVGNFDLQVFPAFSRDQVRNHSRFDLATHVKSIA